MHTYKHVKDGEEWIWVVGHYSMIGDSDGVESRWQAMKDFDDEEAAAAYVNYLNGGTGHFTNLSR
jgi:hypothetical protein